MALLLLAALPVRTAAQNAAGPTVHDENGPTVRAVRATTEILLDGRMDEPVWSIAEPATAFTQRDPLEGEAASERTEVRVAYDSEAIYVAAKMFGPPDLVASRLGRRDADLPGSDWFTVTLDSYHDHLTAYEFSVNPVGVRRDAMIATRGPQPSWDPVWVVATRVEADGWVAELRIPLSQLRYRNAAEQSWGIQFVREISRKNEEAWFAFTPKQDRSGVARFGHLVGLEGLEPGGRLELLPYGLTLASYRTIPPVPGSRFANPFSDGSDYGTEIGLDLKYRVASNLTLDATINPDFGQVEVDPAIINLTAFETRVVERRPFFVEGSDIFRYGRGGPRFVYSRRIGGPPLGTLPGSAVYQDVPDNATILGAVKLTGRVGEWAVGAVDAVTARERGEYLTADGARGRAVVASLSNFFTARARRELRQGQTAVGGLTTVVHRDVSDTVIAARVRSAAYGLGGDLTHDWADRTYSLNVFLFGSRVLGEQSAITSTQQSSSRYYQRPDADHLEVDPTATALNGWAGGVQIDKTAGRHWRGGIDLESTSPGFEVNDLGFQSRVDLHMAAFSLEYLQEQIGSLFRQWNVRTSTRSTWNYGGDRLGGNTRLSFLGQLPSYWSGSVDVRRGFGALDDRLTRGGPLTSSPATTDLSFDVRSDARRAWTGSISTGHDWGAAGSGRSLGFVVGYKPAPSWSVSVSPEWETSRSKAQYLTSVPDDLAATTFGRRYVFAELEQSELALATKLNVTFTPALSLEVYARPFVGSGRFANLKELAAPRTFRFVDYAESGTVVRADGLWTVDPDGEGPTPTFELDDGEFTFRSLRGNAVLRWEWRPGSTLYLVWQQRREETDALGDVRLRRDLRQLARAPAHNIVLLKVSYWLNP